MRSALLTCVFLLPACSDPAAPTRAATEVFASFQQALRTHDEDACRRLLTRESAAVIASLPFAEAAAQKPLRIDGTSPVGSAFHVQVTDPNHGDRRATFVVVREYGQLVVDLVASASANAEVVALDGAANADFHREHVEPRELTPADLERIRQFELTQPPK
ncbi:MAG: hypothetical protein ACK501_22170 [Planctomycetota bacterium]